MPIFLGGVSIGAVLQFVLVFAGGALVTEGLAALARAGLRVALEPQGHRLDRWRRVWFHPERELASLFEALLILAFVVCWVETYRLPGWVAAVLVSVWALHLPADSWSWLRLRRRPQGTRELHERGFLLLDLGPWWLRSLVVVLAAGLYFLFPPVRMVLDTMMSFLLTRLQGWLAWVSG